MHPAVENVETHLLGLSLEEGYGNSVGPVFLGCCLGV